MAAPKGIFLPPPPQIGVDCPPVVDGSLPIVGAAWVPFPALTAVLGAAICRSTPPYAGRSFVVSVRASGAGAGSAGRLVHAPFCFSAEPGGGVKPPLGVGGCAHVPRSWSRIEPGAVTDAAVCRSLPLLAGQET